jgi:hypothetical protein
MFALRFPVYSFENPVQSSDAHRLNTVNTKIGGRDACTTNDLVQQHPERPGLYRIYGRVDDQIMHSSGEKVRSSIVKCASESQ